MKKVLVKILSFVICLSLINLPVFNVSADDSLINMVEDFSTYTSENDFVFEWGVNTTSTTATPGFSDGSYNIIQTSSIPKNAFVKTDFPDPDSPTSASVSPGYKSNEHLRIAVKTLPRKLNWISTSLADNIGSFVIVWASISIRDFLDLPHQRMHFQPDRM